MKKVLLLVETSREFGRQLIIGIARYARLHGPWSFYKEPGDLRSSIPKLNQWKPDGIIMRDTLISNELLELKVPTIMAVHVSNYPEGAHVIHTDSANIAQLAAEHLISKGLKNFAYCGFAGFDWSEERGKYFEEYLQEKGLSTYCHILPKSITNQWEKEQYILSNWLQQLPKPIGVFTCNDDLGQHVLEVCKALNLKVPNDVSVIGVDNDPMVCEISDPPLTSISLNVEVGGFEAARLLDRLMAKKRVSSKSERILITPSHVVQRQSTDLLAVNDLEVARALLYIREHAREKIQVEDVVRATALGRRALEERFRKTLHRSIYDEIRSVRVEMIARMLIETDIPICEITEMFQFTDIEHISRYFKKIKGVSLRQFRNLHRLR